jgi:putative endonuclease
VRNSGWFVYIIECSDNSLYTGITSDLKRRLKEHLSGRGCRYTKVFGASKLVYNESCLNRSVALKRESQIKSWPRKRKIELIGKKSLKRIRYNINGK